MRVLIAIASLIATIHATGDLGGFGLPDATNAACPGLTAFNAGSDSGMNTIGWYADREFGNSDNIQCAVRQVRCDGANSLALDGNGDPQYRYCSSLNMFFIADRGDATCVDSSNSAAAGQCGGVSIDCGSDSMNVRVNSGLVFGETNALLQFGGPVGGSSCQMTDAGDYYTQSVSLTNNEWDTCGVTRELATNNGDISILYTAQILRWSSRDSSSRFEESHNGVTVTREKCFMVTACCYYNADGSVSASFYPSAPNTLVESDKNEINFQLDPRQCSQGSLPGAAPISPVTVYVQDEVCFRASITANTAWHDDIRLSIRRCWATNFDSNFAEGSGLSFNPDSPSSGQVYYPLKNQNDLSDSDVDATFEWDCNADLANGSPDPMEEDFSFSAFRWQQVGGYDDTMGGVDYDQTIYVWCEVNACEVDDFTSDECSPKTGCTDYQVVTEPNRQRRAAHSPLGQMSKAVVAGRMNVMEKPQERRELVSYNLMSDSMSLGMFAMGCVLAVVAIGLFVALKRTRAQIRYGRM
jgi:hypothetical protein